MVVDYSTKGSVALIELNNRPANGLSHELRTSIVLALDRANADPAVTAVVLAGSGKGFSRGAEIKELGTPQAFAEPNLLSVIKAVEESGKPVIAAIHGLCMGGGLE